MTLTNNDKNDIANTRGPDKIAPNYMFLVDWAKMWQNKHSAQAKI